LNAIIQKKKKKLDSQTPLCDVKCVLRDEIERKSEYEFWYTTKYPIFVPPMYAY